MTAYEICLINICENLLTIIGETTQRADYVTAKCFIEAADMLKETGITRFVDSEEYSKCEIIICQY